ncbi:ABC transporter substrate-binding protein [Candidatus Latescibacterota bacterium]
MKHTFMRFLLTTVLIITTGSCDTARESKEPPSRNRTGHGENTANYRRIVSLSPSSTETLFALGLGDRVVGVTRYCKYPPEALEKDKVGGYLDPNYEAIATLNPDLVIVLPGHENIKNYLTELGLAYVMVRNDRVEDILETFTIIGDICGISEKASEIVANMKARIQLIKEQIKDTPRRRVLVSISRTLGTGSLEDVYIAGKNTFYDELIMYAGGVNAYKGYDIEYPVLSAEGLLYLNPDIIIDIVPDLDKRGVDNTAILKDWESVSHVEAVKNRRIHVLSDDYTVIPGPRFIQLLEDFAHIIHPEIQF